MTRPLPRPGIPAVTTYADLAIRTKGARRRATLLGLTEAISDAADDYVTKAAAIALYTYASDGRFVGHGEALERLYRLTNSKTGPGRALRDRILAAVDSHFQRCPYCGVEQATQLDHYLPKTAFPELSVLPDNLVPSCGACNHKKRSHAARTAHEQPFHPYFDDLSHTWLRADLRDSGPRRVVCFRVSPPPSWTPLQERRAVFTFTLLSLDQKYRPLAASEIVSMVPAMEHHLMNGGVLRVEEELSLRLAGVRHDPNSWKSALYLALRGDADFCSGGWNRFVP